MSKLDRIGSLSDTQLMRLHRFFVNEFFDTPLEALGEREINISDKELIHQWKNVFRLKAGDDVVVLDNTGNEYMAHIAELHKEMARLRLDKGIIVKNIPQRNISLFCSLIKKDNFELVLEKGTELGVSVFIPVLSERSEKKSLNMMRARKIIQEASEQSGRGQLPELHEVKKLQEAVEEHNKMQVLALDPNGKPFDISKGFKALSEAFAVFIGPEGGWSNRELEFFKQNNIPIYSLGHQVLRAETAAIAASALFLL